MAKSFNSEKDIKEWAKKEFALSSSPSSRKFNPEYAKELRKTIEGKITLNADGSWYE